MRPHRVGFLRRFDLKTGIHFAHVDLKTGMHFAHLAWNRVWFSRKLRSVWTYLSFPFKMSKERKRNMRIQNEFEYFFCLRCNLRNDNIISAYQDLKNRAAHPHQEFPGVPPPPPPDQKIRKRTSLSKCAHLSNLSPRFFSRSKESFGLIRFKYVWCSYRENKFSRSGQFPGN